MSALTPRLYDLGLESYDLSHNIRLNPTAFVLESCMLKIPNAEKDEIDKRIIYTHRNL